jgi:phosphoglycerate dehydrogenase-like enzyme
MNAPVRIAVLDDYQGVALEMADWSSLPPEAEVTTFCDHLVDEDALAARLAPFQVVCAMRERTPLPRSLLQRLPALRLIVTTGARNAAIDIAAAHELGITVCGTKACAHGTPELTWALILALTRNLFAESGSLRAGGWQVGIGGDLQGRMLGLLGLGRIGSAVAAVGRAFGMKLIAWSPNLTEARAAEHGARLVDKEMLFRMADVLTIHMVLGERTRGLVSARDIGLMQPTAYLVNTSRGPIVDEAALIEALRARRIAGAGLDVFDIEPLPPEHPFRSLPNVLATPHIGYVSRASYEVFYQDTVEDIRAWMAGTPLRVIGGNINGVRS